MPWEEESPRKGGGAGALWDEGCPIARRGRGAQGEGVPYEGCRGNSRGALRVCCALGWGRGPLEVGSPRKGGRGTLEGGAP